MELIYFDDLCLEALEALPNKRSKHCFRSAINHLKRAEKLFPIDRPMAAFRCYTAEEEAASGLMYSLKEHNYLNAEKLKPRDHPNKSAIIEFFKIIRQFIGDNFNEKGIVIDVPIVKEDGEIRLKLVVQMNLNGENLKFVPDPPLNFCFTHQDKKFSYKKQIEDLIKATDFNEINKHIKDLANKRNKLLYAANKGYVGDLEIKDKFFPAFQQRVLAMLRAYLLIEPYKEHQPFVQDSLDAFLAMLGKVELDNLHEDM